MRPGFPAETVMFLGRKTINTDLNAVHSDLFQMPGPLLIQEPAISNTVEVETFRSYSTDNFIIILVDKWLATVDLETGQSHLVGLVSQ